MIIVAIVVSWILIGAVLGLYEARRGHWHWLWLLGAMAGPFSIPLFRQIEQNEQLAQPLELSQGSRPTHAGLKVLVGIDGSDESVDAAKRAAHLFGSRLSALTLAMVTDFEMNELVPGPLTPDEPWDAVQKRQLVEAATTLTEWLGFEPSTVMLNGRPATALHTYASAEDYGLVVVGARGRGLTKRLLGSCATRLAEESSVPVIVMPHRPETEVDSAETTAAHSN